MTIGLIDPREMFVLWTLISENPELHMDDAGPKTFEDFLKHVHALELTIFSCKLGKKFIGAVGFQESTKTLKGIHFISEVRHTGQPLVAVQAILGMLYPNRITAWYFSDNPYIPGFFKKLGGVHTGMTVSTMRDGQPVMMEEVEFHGSDSIRKNLEL